MWRWAVAVPLTSILAPFTIVAILEIEALLRRHQFDLAESSEIALYASVVVLGGLILFALPLTYLLGLLGGRITQIKPKWVATSLAMALGVGLGAVCGRVMVLVLFRWDLLHSGNAYDVVVVWLGAVVGASAGFWWALFASRILLREAAMKEAP